MTINNCLSYHGNDVSDTSTVRYKFKEKKRFSSCDKASANTDQNCFLIALETPWAHNRRQANQLN